MTSLKNYSGDEIAAALAEQLNNEEFVGLYRKADDAWYTKSRTAAAFKQEVDAAQTALQVDQIQNKYLAGGQLTTALGAEGIDNHQPLREYANAKVGSLSQAADDPIAPMKITDREVYEMTGVKPKVETEVDPDKLIPPSPEVRQEIDPEEPAAADQCAHGPEETCQKCLGAPGMAVAVNFANRHLAKIAAALDVAGFVGLANEVDGLAVKFAAKKKKDDEEEKKEKKGKKKDKKKEKEEQDKKKKKEQDKKKKDKKKKEEQAAKDKKKKAEKAAKKKSK